MSVRKQSSYQDGPEDTLAFSHLRWNFVYQRPQHLLSRCHRLSKVHFWEEPVFAPNSMPGLQISTGREGVTVITPLLPLHLSEQEEIALQRSLLDDYIKKTKLRDFIAWYYTPMSLRFSDHLHPTVTVYDCMDELSAFQGAPVQLIAEEQRLFARADVVFCGGASLYSSKRLQHENVHLFPSSIDRKHFLAARKPIVDPGDQQSIPRPRIGFYGVLDERLDRDLLADVARLRPAWHLILLGPVVKIQPHELPNAPNLHYLGQKAYSDLPAYLANWQVAMIPFAINLSTRFISPTKTPEYLAGGKPVVSTPITDVVRPYGETGMVSIAADAAAFVTAIERAMSGSTPEWLRGVDAMLADMSWDSTFQSMWAQIRACWLESKKTAVPALEQSEARV